MKIVTYATHSFGTFPELQKHEDIVVLGYGTKWEGFIKKAKTILEYLDTLPDHEIVVIIDGFDSVIKKTDNLIDVFESFDCKVLVSLDDVTEITGMLPSSIEKYVKYKMFYYCQNNISANSGLIMGYVEYLKIVWQQIIDGPSDDDQRNLNFACKQLPFLKIDTDHVIFQNCANDKCIEDSHAYFCQKPGTITFHRILRGIFEYIPFFIPEIIILLIIIIIIRHICK
jgi:hypothetical protein